MRALARTLLCALLFTGCSTYALQASLVTPPAGMEQSGEWRTQGEYRGSAACYNVLRHMTREPLYLGGRPYTVLWRCVEVSK